MNKFWIVCCYHAYYPYSDIQNIHGVFATEDEAHLYAQRCKAVKHGWDYVEVYSSDELPWGGKEDDLDWREE